MSISTCMEPPPLSLSVPLLPSRGFGVYFMSEDRFAHQKLGGSFTLDLQNIPINEARALCVWQGHVVGRTRTRGASPHLVTRVSARAPRAMSISYRLSEIEGAIPYSDVHKSFSQKRVSWLKATLEHHQNAYRLAELTLELIDAFTPSCIGFLWPEDPEGYTRLRDSCVRIPTATPIKAKAAKDLREVRAVLFARSTAPTFTIPRAREQ